MTISKRLRYEILRRDNHACRYCGATAPNTAIVIDHVIPVTLGGTDEPDNLVAACTDCNNGKSSAPADATLVEDVANDAIRWARAIRQAANDMAEQQDVLDDICDAVAQAWKPRYLPANYRGSLYALIKAGLTEEELIGLVRIAVWARGVDNRWAYFCGCGWKRIKERQDRASQILAEEGPLNG